MVGGDNEVIGAITVLEAPVVFAGTTITPPALKRPRRETVDSSPPPARIATTGNPGSSNELSCIMDAPLSQSMDSVNTVACSNGEDEPHGRGHSWPTLRPSCAVKQLGSPESFLVA
ncbi:hypothetical protein PV327_001710 [Microctonus hyperodae]|uniref:Uncharacterized protein n=1 Tax=Microctonus hyperodae TaxID=165561 RepID=A0AA39FE57_MICHY|nr:hypothetical protein PV327_001710 [Microctonus hyperodae]